MINYAFSLILFISTIPNQAVVEKRFNDALGKVSQSYVSNNLTEAKSNALKAFNMAKDYDYDWGESKALFVLAFMHEESQEYEKALPYYLELLDQYDDFDTPAAFKDKCKIYMNLGNVMMYHSKYEAAIKFYDEGINYARNHQVTPMLIQLLHNKASVSRKAGKFDLAFSSIKEKEKLITNDDFYENLKNLNQLGLIHSEKGELEASRKLFNKIIELEVEDPSPQFTGKALINIADSYYQEGELKKSEAYYRKSLLITKPEEVSSDMFIAYHCLAQILLDKEEFKKAKEESDNAMALFNDVLKDKDNIQIFSLASQIAFELNEFNEGKQLNRAYGQEVSSLLERQEKLSSMGGQYKIDYITTNYFNKIEKRKTLNAFLWVVLAMISAFLGYLGYQKYKKIQIARLIREQMNEVSFNIDEI